MTKHIIIFFLTLFTLSCDIDLYLNDTELALIRPYKKGDKLIFAFNGNEDTIIINKVRIWRQDTDLLASNYNTAKAEVISDDGELISISKYSSNTIAIINFKDAHVNILDVNKLEYTKRYFIGEEVEYFKVEIDYDVGNINEFIWTKKYGIIEYTDSSLNKWVLAKFIRNDINILAK